MSKYICYYKRQSILVEAKTSYEASQKAAKHFKAKRPWDVAVVIAESKGIPIVHQPQSIVI